MKLSTLYSWLDKRSILLTVVLCAGIYFVLASIVHGIEVMPRSQDSVLIQFIYLLLVPLIWLTIALPVMFIYKKLVAANRIGLAFMGAFGGFIVLWAFMQRFRYDLMIYVIDLSHLIHIALFCSLLASAVLLKRSLDDVYRSRFPGLVGIPFILMIACYLGLFPIGFLGVGDFILPRAIVAEMPSSDRKHSIVVAETFTGSFLDYDCSYDFAMVSNNLLSFPRSFYSHDSGCDEDINSFSGSSLRIDWFDNRHIAFWLDDKMRICSINELENIESCKVKASNLGR